MKRPVLRASAVRNPVRVLVILSVVLGLLALLLVKGLKGPQARIAGLAMDGDEDARATATQLEMDGVDVHELIKVLKTIKPQPRSTAFLAASTGWEASPTH